MFERPSWADKSPACVSQPPPSARCGGTAAGYVRPPRAGALEQSKEAAPLVLRPHTRSQLSHACARVPTVHSPNKTCPPIPNAGAVPAVWGPTRASAELNCACWSRYFWR
eukprot:gene18703-biopygen20469